MYGIYDIFYRFSIYCICLGYRKDMRLSNLFSRDVPAMRVGDELLNLACVERVLA
jgi:hypothetical protein